MTGRFVHKRLRFRKSFDFLSKEATHYFPSHMAKGLSRMQYKLKQVDCILEVHDARIPFSGRNPMFDGCLSVRPHLLLLNKADLVPHDSDVIRQLQANERNLQKIIYTDCKAHADHSIMNEVLPAVLQMMTGADRFHRSQEEEFNLLVIGIPNVGKSSLINALRRNHIYKRKATKVGGIAGITKSVLERIKICHHPAVYVLDSPGILAPNVKNVEVGMKLALCATLQDHLVGEDVIADYMLFWLNKHQFFSYVDHFQLETPTDQIYELLSHIATTHNIVQKYRTPAGYKFRPDFRRAAQIAMRAFRDGSLGKFNLDMDELETDENM